MHVLGLGVDEHWLIVFGSGIQKALRLAQCGAEFQLIPEFLVGIEAH